MASRAPSLELALGNELRLLGRLVYKNRNQHQHAKYFRLIIQVHRLLKQLLAEAPLATLLAPEGACPQQQREEPSGTRDLESFKKRLSRTLGWMQYVDEEVLPRTTHCARQILGLVSQGFFLPLALTLLCALARCRSLLLRLVDLIASQYNAATESLKDHEVHLQQLGLPAVICVTSGTPNATLECIWSFPEIPASSSGEARLREERPSVGGGVGRGSFEGGVGKGSETEPTEEGRVREESFPGTPSTLQAGRREPEESTAQAVTAPQSDGNLALDSASRREAAAFGVAGTSGLPGFSPADDSSQARSEGSERNLLGSCQTGALPMGPCMSRQSSRAAEESAAQGQEKGGTPAASAASEQLKRAMLDLGFGDFLGDKRDKKKKRPKSDNK